MAGRSGLALAAGVVALAISLGAQGTVPPVITPVSPTVPGVVSPVPNSSGLSTRSPLTAIVGQVVDTAGRPIAKAAVRLISDRIVETVLTDPKGRFAFTQIPAGEMVVVAQKYGYFDGGYGQRRASGLPLPFSLPYGRTMPNMRIEIFRGSIVTGSVRDEVGEPIVGASVFVARRQFINGEWQYRAVDGELTDDQGQYRIFGLQPGEYVVTVASMPVAANKQGDLEPTDIDRPSMFPRMFYPQTPDRVVALTVPLSAGDVRYAVDFRLPPVRTFRISGKLIGADATGADQEIRLVPMDASWATDETALTLSAQDGTFTFEDVPEGSYRLQAGNVKPRSWVATPGVKLADAINEARTYCGTTEVIVRGADVVLPEIRMVQTAAIAGQLGLNRLGGGSEQSSARRIPISIEPAEPGLSRAFQMSVSPNVAFAVSDLIPGRYFLRVREIPLGWALADIEVDNHSVLDTPIDLKDADAIANITLANRGTEIIGTVRDQRMQAAQGAAVIILPGGVSRENWSPNRVRETRTSTSGVFTVRGLPPGEYIAIVIDDANAEGWQDDRVLSKLTPFATRFTLKPFESLSLLMQMR